VSAEKFAAFASTLAMSLFDLLNQRLGFFVNQKITVSISGAPLAGLIALHQMAALARTRPKR
jgi:hypothetical protein